MVTGLVLVSRHVWGSVKTVTMSSQPPPAHLSPSARLWWTTTVETYELEPHHLLLLQAAAEAWDRCQAARAQIDSEGLTVSGREGCVHAHPCVSIERDNRLAFARMLRELDLDVEPPKSERIGPPAIFSNKGSAARARKASAS
jgi:phage terminase small subunit